MQQVDRQRLEAWTILHGICNVRRELTLIELLAMGTHFGQGAMLDDAQAQGWYLVQLTTLCLQGAHTQQRSATMHAPGRAMLSDFIGLVTPLESVAAMTRLSPG